MEAVRCCLATIARKFSIEKGKSKVVPGAKNQSCGSFTGRRANPFPKQGSNFTGLLRTILVNLVAGFCIAQLNGFTPVEAGFGFIL